METLVPIILQLIGGAAGGNGIGAALKKISLGTLGNTITGLLGGGLGSILLPLILKSLLNGGGISGILTSLIGGGVSGGLLTLIVGLVKNLIARK